ncbi:MAG: hypothetical protein ABI946_01895, partial [Chthoniobacterales bacterium]
MKKRPLHLAFCAIALTAPLAIAQKPSEQKDKMADCPMHAAHTGHAAGVNARGDQGMGFSHAKTTHHFLLSKSGGAIEVTANGAQDQTSREQIRGHLEQIAQAFTAGNFDTPMFVHDQVPAGVPVMQAKKGEIGYRYEEIENGGRVRITTTDP